MFSDAFGVRIVVFKSAPDSGSFGILPAATLAGVPAARLGTRETRIWERMTSVRGPPWSHFDRWGSAEKSDLMNFCVFCHPEVVGRAPVFDGFWWFLMDFR